MRRWSGAAILFWLDQNGLSARDLEPFLGDRAKVTAILARQRALTLTMSRNLSMEPGIPAEVLIPPSRLARAA
ncbi:MAG: hypothetical protein GX442_25815 [Candidatus Riflebacteria bacterium]|nr:hypothetical protein [Candidatus Riflebacteria bacterium]